MKIFGTGILVFVGIVFLMPMFIYWWGLSNLDFQPKPSKLKLSTEQEQAIWDKEIREGKPKVIPSSPYSYIGYFYCNAKTDLRSRECELKYPGLRISALTVRNQVAEQVRGRRNSVWHFTWMAYTIWVTNNWDIHEILATYHETYNT